MLGAKEMMLLNCCVGEDSWESLARRSNQSILKKISPEYLLEGLMLKLKLQNFGQVTHWKRPRCWEKLKAGEKGGHRGWDGWIASLTQWTWVWAGSVSWWWTGKPGVLQSMGLKSRTRLSYWTELNLLYSTRNSTQYSVLTYIGTESKEKWLFAHL